MSLRPGSPSSLSLPVASHQWLERLDDEFLQGLHHVLRGDLGMVTERWNHLASRRDLAPALRQLELPEDVWCALARGARPPLMEALLAAQRLPAPVQRELQDAAEADAETGRRGNWKDLWKARKKRELLGDRCCGRFLLCITAHPK